MDKQNIMGRVDESGPGTLHSKLLRRVVGKPNTPCDLIGRGTMHLQGFVSRASNDLT